MPDPTTTTTTTTATPDADSAVVSFDELSRSWHFSSGDLASPWSLLVATAIVAAIIGALWLFGWLRKRHPHLTPLRIYLSVAGALGLTLTDQWLLLRIARRQRLPSPITLLLSSGTLQFHASKFADHLSLARRRRVLRRVDHIRRTLFGQTTTAN